MKSRSSSLLSAIHVDVFQVAPRRSRALGRSHQTPARVGSQGQRSIQTGSPRRIWSCPPTPTHAGARGERRPPATSAQGPGGREGGPPRRGDGGGVVVVGVAGVQEQVQMWMMGQSIEQGSPSFSARLGAGHQSRVSTGHWAACRGRVLNFFSFFCSLTACSHRRCRCRCRCRLLQCVCRFEQSNNSNVFFLTVDSPRSRAASSNLVCVFFTDSRGPRLGSASFDLSSIGPDPYSHLAPKPVATMNRLEPRC